MKIRSRLISAALSVLPLAALLLAPARADAFCGFYVSGADTKLFNNATQVVLMREGLRTVLSMQNNYEGPPENFAMIVPVPVVLQKENVKTLPKEIFDRVDQLDAPRLVEYWEQDPCAPIGIDNMRPKFMTMGHGAGRGGPPMPDEHGVTVEAQFTVGEYDIVILSAKDGAGLEDWLAQEHYKTPAGSAPFFKPYIEQGSKFFVAKVDTTKVHFENGMAALSPLRFHYDSDRFSLPVRLGLVNAKGAQDLVVHILAKQTRYEVSNYDNVTIPTNLDVAESARAEFGSFYTALYDRTVEKNPKAVVTEYSWDAATCDPCPVPGLTAAELATLGNDVISQMGAPDAGAPGGGGGGAPGGFGPGGPGAGIRGPGGRGFSPFRRSSWVLTRLHARYTKDSLGEDLSFREATPLAGGREAFAPDGKLEHGGTKGVSNNFQARYAIRHPWAGAIECKEPHRGRWGGPPPGDGGISTNEPTPTAARNLAFVKRDPTRLASYVRSELPELGIQGPAPGVPQPIAAIAPSATATAVTTTDVPATPPKKDCGCSVVSRAPIDRGTLASLLFIAGALIARRRSRS